VHPGRLRSGPRYGDAVTLKGTYLSGATEEMSVEVALDELPA
jgi:hypothetical protein